jgi:hypothetical protein
MQRIVYAYVDRFIKCNFDRLKIFFFALVLNFFVSKLIFFDCVLIFFFDRMLIYFDCVLFYFSPDDLAN